MKAERHDTNKLSKDEIKFLISVGESEQRRTTTKMDTRELEALLAEMEVEGHIDTVQKERESLVSPVSAETILADESLLEEGWDLESVDDEVPRS